MAILMFRDVVMKPQGETISGNTNTTRNKPRQMAVVPLANLSPPANDKPRPLLGLGTAAYPFNGHETKAAVVQAIGLGYRHFDSAALYGSEVPLGDAISVALRLGLVKSRDELFITSKLWCTDAHRDCVLPALQNSLKNLGLEYLDLYLVHWPVSIKPGSMKFPDLNKEDIVPMDFKAVWEAMEECQQLGFTKSIGVSNFSSKKLQILLSTSRIPPAVNQLEINPMCQQKKLREFCEQNGIHVSGYSPLGASGTPWGSNVVMESKVLQEIARNKGKSLAQICLRWAYEQRVSVIVKSFNKDRMVQNLDIFNWELSPEDLEKISELPQGRGCTGDQFIFPGRGPYESLDDLWDGEV